MPSTSTSRLDGLTTSVAVKPPCRIATTANHSLSGLAAVDGVTPSAGDRILVAYQTDKVENGIYVAASNTWTRAKDFNGSLDVVGGTLVTVIAGDATARSAWHVLGEGAVVVGTDEIEFELSLFGSPSGNVESAGLFTTLAAGSTVIRAGTDRVRTSGYSTVGVGGADYVYDADVDAAHVTANPRTSFLAADGRGFTLSLGQAVTPYMTGCAGFKPSAPFNPPLARPTAGIPDDAVPLQAWADLIGLESSVGGDFVADGMFGTSEPIEIGPSAPYTAPRSLGGNFMLVSLAPMAKLLTFRHADSWGWNGNLTLVGGDSEDEYASRDVQAALAFEGRYTRFIISGSVQCAGFQLAGVVNITNAVNEFGEWLTIAGGLFGWDIGSGPIPAVANMALTGAYSARVNSGSAFAQDQRTTMTMATMPPTFLDDYGAVGDQVIAVKIGDRPYRVTSINRADSKITVYPWVETAAPASGTLDYIFGGVFMEGGPDGSLANIPLLASSRSVGWNCAATYPSNIGYHTSQFDSCALLMGNVATAQFGGRWGGFYSEEDASTYEVVVFNGDNNRLSCGGLGMANLERWWTPFQWDGASDIANPGFKLWTFEGQQWEKGPNGQAIDASILGEMVTIEANKPTAVFDPVDNFTLTVATFDPEQDRHWGVRSRRVVIAGTGANGEPTGTITVATEGAETVNGGATVAYTGLKTPLHLVITADPETGNLSCRRLGTVPAVAMADLGADPTQADFNTLLAKLRANGTLAT